MTDPMTPTAARELIAGYRRSLHQQGSRAVDYGCLVPLDDLATLLSLASAGVEADGLRIENEHLHEANAAFESECARLRDELDEARKAELNTARCVLAAVKEFHGDAGEIVPGQPFGNMHEVYHQLYAIACPRFDEYKPFERFEKIVADADAAPSGKEEGHE